MGAPDASTAQAHVSLSQWYEVRTRVLSVLDGDRIRMVFQPVVDLVGSEVIGVEALARFSAEPVRSPDEWFDEAWRVGHGMRLELAAMRVALRALDTLPAGRSLFVNATAETLLEPEAIRMLRRTDASRLVIEIAANTQQPDHGPTRDAIEVLWSLGVRIALDDRGVEHRDLGRLFALAPDIVKLDVASHDLTDPRRHAAASLLVALADGAGIGIVAKGIESPAQVDALLALGITLGQGHHLAGPGPHPATSLR